MNYLPVKNVCVEGSCRAEKLHIRESFQFAKAINNTARVECGFAAVKNVEDQKLDDQPLLFVG